MRKRKWRDAFSFLPSPSRSWLMPAYGFVLGAIPAIGFVVSDGFRWLPIMVAVLGWCSCFAIWFIAELLM